MPEDNKAQEQQVEPAKPEGRIWTDAEHDAYVKARIDKQAARYAETKAELDARIAELEAANKEKEAKLAEYEARISHEELVASVSKDTGLPADVVANLKGDDAETLRAAAEAIKASVRLYPTAPSGANPGPVRTPSMTRDQIAEISDPRRRLEAIKANLGAYESD